MQHQVAAVIVAVAEDGRLRRELADDDGELLAQRGALIVGQRDAAVRLEEVLREEVELPRQLLDVERDAVGQVLRRGELRAAPLQRRDQRHRLAVEGGVIRRARGAEVRLERDVAEILQREHAEIVRVPQHRRNRHRHLRHQRRDVHERQLRDVERRRVQRQHDDGASGSRMRK